MVIAAAIKDHDGTVYSIPAPARHYHIIRLMVDKGIKTPITGDQGFLLSDGRFVDRMEAAKIALSCHQCKELKFNSTLLFSEDLW
jgi:hypothetical protein